MNGTALSTTAACSVSVGALAAPIGWFLAGCPQPVPEPVTIGLASLAIPVIHLVYQWLVRKSGMPVDGAGAAAVAQS